MTPLAYLAPFWLLFEIGQLVVGERYLGIKQIQVGVDPRRRGPGELLSFLWVLAIVLYLLWMIAILVQGIVQPQTWTMLGVTAIGYAFRSSCGLKWVLVILTFEGAIRIGMLLSLSVAVWRRL